MGACEVIDVQTAEGHARFEGLALKSNAYSRGRGLGDVRTRDLLLTVAFNLRLPKPSRADAAELCPYTGDVEAATALEQLARAIPQRTDRRNSAHVAVKERDALLDARAQGFVERAAKNRDRCAIELLNRMRGKAGLVDTLQAAEHFRHLAAELTQLRLPKYAKFFSRIATSPTLAASLLAPDRAAVAPVAGTRKPPRTARTRRDTEQAQNVLFDFEIYRDANASMAERDIEERFAAILSARERTTITRKRLMDRLRNARKVRAESLCLK